MVLDEIQLEALTMLQQAVKTVFGLDAQIEVENISSPREYSDLFKANVVINFDLKYDVYRANMGALCQLRRDQNNKRPLWQLYEVTFSYFEKIISVYARRSSFGVEFVSEPEMRRSFSVEERMEHFESSAASWPKMRVHLHT